MLKHVNINDLTSRVYNYCNIMIAFFFKSLILKTFMYIHCQDVVPATAFLIAFYESNFLFAISFS